MIQSLVHAEEPGGYKVDAVIFTTLLTNKRIAALLLFSLSSGPSIVAHSPED